MSVWDCVPARVAIYGLKAGRRLRCFQLHWGWLDCRIAARRVIVFPIASVAKLLIQLAAITPAVNVSIEKTRQLIDTIRKPGAGTQSQLDDLKKAVELQAVVNKEINDKLKLIETVLRTMQKSLNLLLVTGAGIGLIALLALVVAIMK